MSRLASLLGSLAICSLAIWAYQDAEGLHRAGVASIEQGRYVEAEATLRQALAVLERAKDPGTPVTMLLLARALLAQAKFGEAERLLVLALDRMKQPSASGQRAIAGALQALAVLYWSAEKYQEAEATGQRALAILSAAAGPEDPEAAIILSTLGQVKKERGKRGEASRLFERALAILEPASSPELPGVLFLLGLLRYEQKKPHEAEQLYRRALETQRAIDAKFPAHPLIASLLSALALACMKLGKREEAQKLSNEAVELAGKVYAPDHLSAAAILWNHAQILRSFQRKDEAKSVEARAREIVRSAPPNTARHRVDVKALSR